ncbi:hypothetical protein [Mesobacillus zeae]|uniref:Uncharacterized protein n=1 Tax=Mesobacillus zeae TaxID=1917180 RepID=A0A398AZL6_9BACI|nr:hypothetical protein [Mesobacillus zeae]RID82921.1 hypothetical protein D1970_17675 [Mesobacillus zeae]
MEERKKGHQGTTVPAQEKGVVIQAELVCDKHPSCCYAKGCPGEYTVLNGKLGGWTGRCCY